MGSSSSNYCGIMTSANNTWNWKSLCTTELSETHSGGKITFNVGSWGSLTIMSNSDFTVSTE